MSEDPMGRGRDHAFSNRDDIASKGVRIGSCGPKIFTYYNDLWTSKAYPYPTKSYSLVSKFYVREKLVIFLFRG